MNLLRRLILALALTARNNTAEGVGEDAGRAGEYIRRKAR